MNPIKKHIFPNGFTLVYQPSTNDLPIASLYAYIRVGSIHETDENRGASHFIEHMCFKGTQQLQNANEIYTSYNKIGAVFNAFTEKDHTCFYVDCGDEYIQHCLSILSDMILNSVFKKKEFLLETPVVLEEMIREEDDPDTQLLKDSDMFLYNGTPYVEQVDDIEYHRKKIPYDYQQTIRYYRHYYQPQNMVVSVISKHSFDKIKRLLSNTFFLEKREPTTKYITQNIGKKEAIVIQPTTDITYRILEKKGMESQHLMICFRTCTHSHIDRFALNMLSQIIGGGMGSRMYMLLREENGLTYESSCSTDYLRIGGEFTLYAVLDPHKLFKNDRTTKKGKGVLPLIIGLLRDLIKKGIRSDELQVAKGNWKGKTLLKQQKIQHVAQYNGLQETIYPEEPIVPYDQLFATYYEKLTVQQLNDVIAKYWKPSNMYVSIIGEKGRYSPTLEQMKAECKHCFSDL
jgi:predicted Zn-dependent peptidase